jgi:hypothetical protein
MVETAAHLTDHVLPGPPEVKIQGDPLTRKKVEAMS